MGRLTPTNGGAEPCSALSGLEVAEGVGVDVDVGVEVGVIDPRFVLLAPPLSPSGGGPSPCRRCNNSPDKCIAAVKTSVGLAQRLRSEECCPLLENGALLNHSFLSRLTSKVADAKRLEGGSAGLNR